MYSQAVIPTLISKSSNKVLANIFAVVGGVLLLSLLAQVAIPLPWTPVPITGQTFGVSLVSLLWGWKRGGTVLLSYLALGASGVSVFAMGTAGLAMGPTIGYLVGMFLASVAVGTLADRGFTKTYFKSLLAAYVGSFIIFTCGVIGLSFFLPTEALLISGVLPFLPGDLIKNVIAAGLAFNLKEKMA